MRRKGQTVTKTWDKLSEKEKTQVQKSLRIWQNPRNCKYVFYANGELLNILDYSAFGNMFKL